MNVEFVPLLQTQRAIYDNPAGISRFQEYLHQLTGDDGDMSLPLSYLNPMGKEHVPRRLDEYLVLGAETIAGQAVKKASERLKFAPGEFRASLLLADDAGGGWTHRELTEADHHYFKRGERRRGWITALLWTGESPDLDRVRREMMAAIFRASYFALTDDRPLDLGELLRLEALASLFARESSDDDPLETLETLDADSNSGKNEEKVRELLCAHYRSQDFPTLFAIFFGDEAARSAGYTELGLQGRVSLEVTRRRIEGLLNEGGLKPETVLQQAARLPLDLIFRE